LVHRRWSSICKRRYRDINDGKKGWYGKVVVSITVSLLYEIDSSIPVGRCGKASRGGKS
jgi:hypothetical protein